MRMSKLAGILIGLVAALGSATGAAATTFKIATVSPDGTQWMTRIRAAADEVANRTDKRVQFRFYPGGVMGTDDAVLRKIRAGQLQGGMLAGGSLDAIYADSQIYSLPLVFRSFDEVDYVRARMDSIIQQGLERNGFVSFGLADGGFAHVFASQPVRGIDDVRGRKVWLPPNDPIARAVFDVVGLSPVTLPLSDVMTGLQTGMIDTLAVSPVGAVALQWYTKLKYATDTPLLYTYGTMIIERRAFEKLAPADQAVVREVMGKAFKDIDRQNRADQAGAREALRRQGVEFVAVAPDKLAQWQEAARQARERLAASGVYSKQMWDTLQGHLDEFRRASPGGKR
jgi:TRAP-type C4-dicarboxylate transport system substrate-binding protein